MVSGYFLSGVDDAGNATGNPYACFFGAMIVGFLIALSGFFIDKELEANQAGMLKMGFIKRTVFVFREVISGLRIRELWTSVIYKTLLGTVVPSFGTYLYYYQIDVTGFTQWQYSIL